MGTLCSFNYIYREVQLRDGREASETAQSERERERERKRAKTFWGKSGKKIRGKRGQPPLQGVCVCVCACTYSFRSIYTFPVILHN